MPELVSPVQQRQTIMKIRPYRRGWPCFEAPGVEPFWTGENRNKVLSIMLKVARNLGAVRFAYSGQTDQLNA
jgi:hypothetical protein